jgi:hypothetical protein
MQVIHFWTTYRKQGIPYPPGMLETLERVSGVWEATPESCDAWAKEYSEALGLLDGLSAGWYTPYAQQELKFLNEYAPNSFKMPLRCLEPYYVSPERRWTRLLAGKRVAVVSSFAETIQEQVFKSDQLWLNLDSTQTVLPIETSWIPIRTYFPPKISMGGSTGWNCKGWQDAVDSIVEKVLRTNAEIVLIGCGALGMCIGGRLREAGRSVILLGGAIQVLFGIKGKRWESHPIISKFWNSAWVYPSAEETPLGATSIEGGCYWGK